ncbi:MAG: glutamate racemase [Spirochaetes bacterium]|jgi:glutamate racemase|nr:glutamate racemase [Spirochaetota bacterium]
MAVPIAFIDSGIGGIPYLIAARTLLPSRRFLYIADTKYFPYGEKSAETIRKAVCQAVERLLAVTPVAAVVVACNTASVVALEDLRRRFGIPIVGVVPAVKPAAETSASGRIGVLATPRTAQGEYLHALIQRFAADAEVVVHPAPALVDFVEHRLPDASQEERHEVLLSAVKSFVEAKVDRIVLGCTHFIHLRAEIESLVGPHIQVVDSVDGVARQLVRVLNGVKEGDDTYPDDALFVTSSIHAPAQYASMADSAGLRYAGELAP